MPKNELMRVWPGSGHTKPLGLKSIISESFGREKEYASESMIGIKNMQIKINIIKIKLINELKNLLIKSPHIQLNYLNFG